MRGKKLSREAFNAIVSRFLKDILDRFAIIGVNDELIASAIPIAVKHALPSSDCFAVSQRFISEEDSRACKGEADINML